MGVFILMQVYEVMAEAERRTQEHRRKLLQECTPEERVALEAKWEKERLEAIEERRHQEKISALNRIADAQRMYFL